MNAKRASIRAPPLVSRWQRRLTGMPAGLHLDGYNYPAGTTPIAYGGLMAGNDRASSWCEDLVVPISDKDHLDGPRSAAVVLVEYGDYECPDCLNAWPVVQELRREFGDRLAFVFRHFPQSSIHPHASAAAQAAEAAGAQGRYWPMHDLLFSRQKDLATLDLTHLALQLGLEVYRFQSALDAEAYLRKIEQDSTGGQRSGVKGTPTFFVNGCRYRGSAEFEAMAGAIRALLPRVA
jgi:protein-disulfide isomerase